MKMKKKINNCTYFSCWLNSGGIGIIVLHYMEWNKNEQYTELKYLKNEKSSIKNKASKQQIKSTTIQSKKFKMKWNIKIEKK